MKPGRILLIAGLMAGACFLMGFSTSRANESGVNPVIDVYRIHINDEMEISVYDKDGTGKAGAVRSDGMISFPPFGDMYVLGKTVIVRPDGMISFPLIEDVYVLGKTTAEIRESMEKLLAAHVETTKVTLLVTKFYKPQVYILGEISAPGPYELTDPYIMYKLLAQARLVHPRMDEHKVVVVRDGVSMPVALKSGTGAFPGADSFKLEDGDVIYVSYQGTTSAYVLGDVPVPGFYPIPEDASNLLGLLASAKALDDQIVSSEVTLIRGGEIRAISVKNPPDGFELLPNDVILIKPAKKESITVTGYVKSPGIFPYVEGQTLLDVITRAGGFSDEGASNAVEICRNYPDRPEIIKVGDLHRTTGDIPAICPGDVINVPKKKLSTSKYFIKKVLPVIRDMVIISKVLND